MSEIEQPAAPERQGVSRRTVTKAMAWSVPVIAVAGTAPTAAASLLPCVADLAPVGGTYPVTVNLSGCTNSVANPNHWDFNFKITVAEQNGTDCDCDAFRVTLYDNPPRSRLGIQGGAVFDDWGTRTQPDPRMYIQKELPPGGTATFPATNDQVYRVAGASPWNGYDFPGTFNLTITAPGTADDSVHALYTPGGGIPCGASGPYAFYRVDCKKNGVYTQLGGIGNINPCIPMITVDSVCRFDTTGNDRYRVHVSVLTTCPGISNSDFRVTRIQRNNDTNFPNDGDTVWTGNQVVGGGTSIDMDVAGNSGGQLWISFTTDNGANTSIIRVPTNNTACTENLQSTNNASTESTTEGSTESNAAGSRSTTQSSRSTAGSSDSTGGSDGAGDSSDSSGGSAGSTGGSSDTSGGSGDASDGTGGSSGSTGGSDGSTGGSGDGTGQDGG